MNDYDEYAIKMPPPPFIEPLDSANRPLDAIYGTCIPYSFLVYDEKGRPRDSRYPWRWDEPGYVGPLPNHLGLFDENSLRESEG